MKSLSEQLSLDDMDFSQYWQLLAQKVNGYLDKLDVVESKTERRDELADKPLTLPDFIASPVDMEGAMKMKHKAAQDLTEAQVELEEATSDLDALADEIWELANMRDYFSNVQKPFRITVDGAPKVLLVYSDRRIDVLDYADGMTIPNL
jgi:hypothetical protein